MNLHHMGSFAHPTHYFATAGVNEDFVIAVINFPLGDAIKKNLFYHYILSILELHNFVPFFPFEGFPTIHRQQNKIISVMTHHHKIGGRQNSQNAKLKYKVNFLFQVGNSYF